MSTISTILILRLIQLFCLGVVSISAWFVLDNYANGNYLGMILCLIAMILNGNNIIDIQDNLRKYYQDRDEDEQ